jgi:hypothetical protein
MSVHLRLLMISRRASPAGFSILAIKNEQRLKGAVPRHPLFD